MSANYVYCPCFTCIQNGNESFPSATMYKFLINSTGVYEGKCQNGHDIKVRLQGFTFEHLLSMAVEDFRNKDYRSAVTNMVASMERFFAFVNDLLMREKGLSPEDRKAYMQFFKSSSERELGAFLTSYTIRFQSVPFIQTEFEKKAKIRNKVVHKGEIPNRKEAEGYCSFVFEMMQDVITRVLENVREEFVLQAIADNFDSKEMNKITVTACQSVISWTLQTPSEIQNEKNLQKVGQENPHHYAEMANQANSSNKRLWVNDDGELVLLSSDEIPGRDERKQYAGRTTFKELVERQSLQKGVETILPIVNMPEN